MCQEDKIQDYIKGIEGRLIKIMAGCFFERQKDSLSEEQTQETRNKKFDDQKTNKMILERLMNQGQRMSRIIAEDDNSR